MKASLYTDGGSRGNPGPAATGFVLLDENGQILLEEGHCIGIATNNKAEYLALIAGLKACQACEITQIEIFMDSQLIVRQLQGQYKVKHPELLLLYQTCQALLAGFRWRIEHIPREKNKTADRLVNEALDHPQKVIGGQAQKSRLRTREAQEGGDLSREAPSTGTVQDRSVFDPQASQRLAQAGFEGFAYAHKDLLRLVLKKDQEKFFLSGEERFALLVQLRELGYRYVTLDIGSNALEQTKEGETQ